MALGTICMEPAVTATPASEPQPRYWLGGLLCVAAALLSGALLWACHQPLALGSYLGWIALVPFLILVRWQARPRFVYLAALLGGFTFFLPALQWMRVADYRMNATWFLLALHCTLFYVVGLALIRWLDRKKTPLLLSVPLVLVVMEWFRSFLLTGFAWYYLAHTQHDLLPIIQITDIGGIYMVSFLVAAVNAFLFDCIYQVPEIRRWFSQEELAPYRYYSSVELLNRSFFSDWLFRRNLLLEGAALALLVFGAWSYGDYRLAQNHFSDGPRVALLQSNIDQRMREYSTNRNNYTLAMVGKHFDDLRRRAVQNLPPSEMPQLIIWPETSYPFSWIEVSPNLPIEKVPDQVRTGVLEMQKQFYDLQMATSHDAGGPIPHLIGMNTYYLDENAKPRHYNSAILLNERGEFAGKFDKMHPIPFGEYVPLKDWIPFMNVLAPYDYDYGIQPGESFTRFKVGNYHFGVLICYEDTDPFLARRYLESSTQVPEVDFLVNISNDGWFDGSCEHEEHLAVSRFRAIECRRAMVRSVNMGISAVIDGNGRILKPTQERDGKPPMWVVRPGRDGKIPDLPVEHWHYLKKVTGVLVATVPIDHRFSLYAVLGDWLPVGCCLCLVASAGVSIFRRRKAQP